ncbi:MAG: hypothetical protein FJX76_18000, partial [Armatimonadetes bacterium]|nr:hypothetical protein [Armatimonadota bacterium]
MIAVDPRPFEWAEDLGHDADLISRARAAEEATEEARARVRRIAQANQVKVLRTFLEVGWSEGHFFGSTGYGYHDSGREALDDTVARIF